MAGHRCASAWKRMGIPPVLLMGPTAVHPAHPPQLSSGSFQCLADVDLRPVTLSGSVPVIRRATCRHVAEATWPRSRDGTSL